jgi:C-terminal processing protease CtpA/Prc
MLGQRPDGRLFIREAPKGLPAAEADLRAGDEVLLIDGRDVRTLGPARLHGVLSGDAGTKVRLTVVRGESIVRASLERRTPSTMGRKRGD